MDLMHVRCTLTNFKRNYLIKIFSKQINKNKYDSSLKKLETNLNMNPGFLTGFSDAESSFVIRINKKKSGG
jgi:hypothetical protein